MSGNAGRRLGTWFNVLAGVLAVGFWASNALRAAFGDDDLSTRALFLYLSLVLIGLAFATLLDVFTAPARAKLRESGSNAAAFGEPRTQSLLSALWVLGVGAGPILDASPGASDWTLLVAGSLAGGLILGAAFALASEQRQVTPGHATERHPPSRYDWR